MHFLSKDKKSGGHLLQCKIKSGRIDLDNSYQLNIILPKSREFSQTDLIPEDKESVRKVEQGN
ncbi:MAG: acetolactate decarboxylase [Candidatus Omnitrophica bacterium]|nr:acetolactate decarboxylase [Candidatus Omnitrophota bacterium]